MESYNKVDVIRKNKQLITTIVFLSVTTIIFLAFNIPYIYTWKYLYPNTNPGEPDKVWYFINVLGCFLEPMTHWTIKIISISFLMLSSSFYVVAILNLIFKKNALFVASIITFVLTILISVFIVFMILW